MLEVDKTYYVGGKTIKITHLVDGPNGLAVCGKTKTGESAVYYMPKPLLRDQLALFVPVPSKISLIKTYRVKR